MSQRLEEILEVLDKLQPVSPSTFDEEEKVLSRSKRARNEIFSMLRFRSFERKRLSCELRHDRENARKLVGFDVSDLREADLYLRLIIERRKARIALFSESTEKLSFLPFVSAIWRMFKDLSNNHFDLSPTSLQLRVLILLGLAAMSLLGGFFIGRFLLGKVSRTYEYQREILAIVLAQRTEPQKMAWSNYDTEVTV